MFLMMIIWAFVFAGLVFLFIKLFNADSENNDNTSLSSSVQILKERYARGEIDRAEFESMKRNLAG